MSFYLGKDNSGNSNYNILHLTEGYTAIDTIKSSTPLSNTLFHSNLPYLQTKAIEEYDVYTSSRYNNQWYNYAWSVKLSNTVIDLINEGYQFTLLVKTKNSGGSWVSVGYAGIFAVSAKPYYTADVTIPKYMSGPNNDPFTWSKSNTLSYTNCYLRIVRAFSNSTTIAEATGKVLNDVGFYDNRQDIVYGCKVLVYDLKSTTTDVSINSIGVNISPSLFTIKTATSVLDMKSFYPIQSTSVETANSFRSINLGDSYITPYIPDSSDVVGWVINANSTEPTIHKKLSSGSLVKVSSNSDSKLYFSRKVRASFDLTANNSTEVKSNIVTLAANELAFAYCSATFVSNLVSSRTMEGTAHFIDNNTSHVILEGSSMYQINGSERGSYFTLEVYSTSNQIGIRNITAPAGAVGESGRFYGTIDIFILKVD